MQLYILRHAIAVARGTPEYEGRDDERPLTDDGIKKMEAAAEGMKEIGLTFDRIYTSPILRARHTAEIVADELKAKKILEHADELGNDFSCDAALELIRRAGADEKILLVGHQPDLGELAQFLLLGRFGLHISLKKGALMRIDFDGEVVPGEGTLMWLLEPGHLRAFD